MQNKTLKLGCSCEGTDDEPLEPTPALLRHVEDVADGVRDSSKKGLSFSSYLYNVSCRNCTLLDRIQGIVTVLIYITYLLFMYIYIYQILGQPKYPFCVELMA